ncbi:unnamed protein product [Calypogeia fissa]
MCVYGKAGRTSLPNLPHYLARQVDASESTAAGGGPSSFCNLQYCNLASSSSFPNGTSKRGGHLQFDFSWRPVSWSSEPITCRRGL